MATTKFFNLLIKESERGANIARICRKNENLLKLLTQEKSDDEKNSRFLKDFKTLADVLIQETLKFYIAKEYPMITVQGEESNVFENSLGESVVIQITDDKEDIKSVLEKILEGNEAEVSDLIDLIYEDVEVKEIFPSMEDDKLDLAQIGVWIDPIDGTNEFISAKTVNSDNPNIAKSGLTCVTVLIGAFDKNSRSPIFGVINQPFHEYSESSYVSKIFYGASINGFNINNIPEDNEKKGKIAIISSSETRKQTLEEAGYTTVESSGAGYKILKVILSDASMYFLSGSSTYKWDTCAGHAILKSLGGEIIDLMSTCRLKKPIPLTYDSNEEGKFANNGGLIAFRSINHLINLVPYFWT